MLICHRCGLTNLPYNVACPVCGRPLQDEAAAAAKRGEWDALPKDLREEQESVFERMRDGHQQHHQWLQKNRWTQTVLGALLVNMILGGSTLFCVPWSIPVDLIIGGAAGWALNVMRGGAYRGLGLFTAAAFLSTIIRFALANLTRTDFGVGVVMLPFAFLGMLVAGYLVGMKMDASHGERSTVA
jgi:hypothetical protein